MLGSPPADLHAHPRARYPLLPSSSPHPTGTPQRADVRVHFVIGSFHADTARRQRGQHRNPRCFLFLVPLSPAETSARSRCSLAAVRTEGCGFPASSQPLSAPQPSAARTERCAHRHRAVGQRCWAAQRAAQRESVGGCSQSPTRLCKERVNSHHERFAN